MYDYRPQFHYQPKQNWMNDPNGLVQYQGLYHLYYQYNPHGAQWGDIHWGHATSKDLIDWETKPIAMTPAINKGELHCFSGGCCIRKDQKPTFFYTSVGDEKHCRDAKDGAEQWLAFADESLNTLTQTDEYALKLSMHNGIAISEWRDPYVIPYKEGYLMVLGCRLGDRGACLLYTSEDSLHFSYHHVLAQAQDCDEYSWECPNFFPLEDKYVLLYSPCKSPMYKVGTLDSSLNFHVEAEGLLDPSGWEGFYAPQSFQDEAGRRILFGWMTDSSRGDWKGIEDWSGSQSLPREVTLGTDGHVKMCSLPGLKHLQETAVDVAIEPTQPFCGFQGNQFVIKGDMQISPSGMICFQVLKSSDGQEHTDVALSGDGILTVDRSASSLHQGTHHTKISRELNGFSGAAQLEFYVDHSIIEVCVNGEWISTQFYPAMTDSLAVEADVLEGKGQFSIGVMKKIKK